MPIPCSYYTFLPPLHSLKLKALYKTNVIKMMWLASLLILTSLGGSFGEDLAWNCFTTETDKCDKIVIPKELPENEEELMEACKNIQAHVSCVANAREECGQDEERISSDRNLISYLRSTCQDHNPVFKVISSNLQCIQPLVTSFERHDCLGLLSDEAQDDIWTHTDPFYENYRSGFMTCLNYMRDKTCVTETLGHHCGEDVKDAVETFLEDIAIKPTTCTQEIMEELGPIYEIFKEIIIQDLQLQEALEEKRK